MMFNKPATAEEIAAAITAASPHDVEGWGIDEELNNNIGNAKVTVEDVEFEADPDKCEWLCGHGQTTCFMLVGELTLTVTIDDLGDHCYTAVTVLTHTFPLHNTYEDFHQKYAPRIRRYRATDN